MHFGPQEKGTEGMTRRRPSILRELITNGARTKVKPGKKHKDTFLSDCLRQKRASVFETLNDCSKPPFAWPRSPYEYRAFALCSPEKGNAVLFVDIHT